VYSVAAALIAVNWLVYIWGVNVGYVIETSLGYFIAPLVNVLTGVIFWRITSPLLILSSSDIASSGQR